MPKLTIDGVEIEVPKGMTVYQAAQTLGHEIPVFCFHQRLDIAGNCRMCLVQVEGSPKPVASCAMPAGDGMVVHTKGDFVKKARESVLEFLLMNHPLDCPICDQGGECDLQDITMSYGRGYSRYEEMKRAVPPKQMGPIVKTFMTRCIHCTRCVRFSERVAGEAELGAVSRGERTEITTYLDASIRSELSGNLVDLCPVGALTSAPYAFKGRPWDLERTNSIDVMDATGSNISIHTYNRAVKRILPRTHEGINEEWISDKSRYACDGLSVQRLDRPYIRQNGKLQPATFEEAFAKIASKLKGIDPKKVAVAAGPFADGESLFLLKELFGAKGSTAFYLGAGQTFLPQETRAHYLFNTSIAGIEDADACLIIGANVRRDAPMVHTRLRKHYLESGMPIAYLGGVLDADRDFNFVYDNLGSELKTLEEVLTGKHAFSKVLKAAQKPMLILGYDALERLDGQAIFEVAAKIAETYGMIQEDWNGFNLLHNHASAVAGLDLGYHGRLKESLQDRLDAGAFEFLYLYGEDGLDLSRAKKHFVVYQGHHGDKGAMSADVILPGAAYTEKDALYINTEGRVQETFIALAAPGEAREDWRILRALCSSLDVPMAYNSLDEVRSAMRQVHNHFKDLDTLPKETWKKEGSATGLQQEKFASAPFKASPFNFYQSDIISKNSVTMAKCQQELVVDYREKASQ